MTNFATWIDSASERAPIAKRGHSKQKRSGLRIVGLGLVVSTDGGIPLVSRAYPGNKPGVTQFGAMVGELVARFATLLPDGADGDGARLTLVYDAGQNSDDNYKTLDGAALHFVGSLPPSDHPGLLAVSKDHYGPVDQARFPGLVAFEARKAVFGAERRLVVCHSDGLHAKQSQGFDQTLAKAHRQLAAVQARLARGKTRKAKEKVEAEIAGIVARGASPRHRAPARLRRAIRPAGGVTCVLRALASLPVVDVRRLAQEERTDFAAFLATLPPRQWQAPTLCACWRVRDVVAHVISYDNLGPRGLLALAVQGRFRLGQVNAAALARYDRRSPEQLLALLTTRLQPRGVPAALGGRVGLVEGLIHHQDIRRPLGLPRVIPAERLLPALRVAVIAPDIAGLWRIRGVRLLATDLNFSFGAGPEVRGTAETLLMAIAGRRGVVGELSGPGQGKLAGRIDE